MDYKFLITSVLSIQLPGGGIGKDGKTLYSFKDIPEDKEIFQRHTKETDMFSGARTFSSFWKPPLADRNNIVISRTGEFPFKEKAHDILPNLVAALAYYGRKNPETNKTIVGGKMLYDEAFPLSHQIAVTEIKGTREADTFVELPLNDFFIYTTGPWKTATCQNGEVVSYREVLYRNKKFFTEPADE